MRKFKIIAVLGFAILAVGISDNKSPSQLQAEKQAKELRITKAKQIAKAWFDSLMQGNTAVTTSLSAVPFEMDRKQTVKTITELEAVFELVKETKGKRDLKIAAIKVITNQDEINRHNFPAGNIVISVLIGKEKVFLCIKPTGQYKVIGMSD